MATLQQGKGKWLLKNPKTVKQKKKKKKKQNCLPLLLQVKGRESSPTRELSYRHGLVFWVGLPNTSVTKAQHKHLFLALKAQQWPSKEGQR